MAVPSSVAFQAPYPRPTAGRPPAGSIHAASLAPSAPRRRIEQRWPWVPRKGNPSSAGAQSFWTAKIQERPPWQRLRLVIPSPVGKLNDPADTENEGVKGSSEPPPVVRTSPTRRSWYERPPTTPVLKMRPAISSLVGKPSRPALVSDRASLRWFFRLPAFRTDARCVSR